VGVGGGGGGGGEKIASTRRASKRVQGRGKIRNSEQFGLCRRRARRRIEEGGEEPNLPLGERKNVPRVDERGGIAKRKKSNT